MKLGLLLLSLVLLSACDNNSNVYMAACSEACVRGLRPMVRWNDKEGCLCGSNVSESTSPAPVVSAAPVAAPSPAPPAPPASASAAPAKPDTDK